jgi:hypothetical protein
MVFLLAVLAVRWCWDLGLRRPSFEILGEGDGGCAGFVDLPWMVFRAVPDISWLRCWGSGWRTV